MCWHRGRQTQWGPRSSPPRAATAGTSRPSPSMAPGHQGTSSGPLKLRADP
eukprot:CAMPEP_0175439990 /NCGR_PEP_ID=MMETSP0095-20121207/56835_1 /TAXON_ID=311494 /ORGANISM="Alexandrium monilatum, Strain CCMP3105" /LENGTH=50 /DNA_ID=CAMNT_0016739841 /DNA_START=118 /DNA_END=267 /DNA_ORIENTATION=-